MNRFMAFALGVGLLSSIACTDIPAPRAVGVDAGTDGAVVSGQFGAPYTGSCAPWSGGGLAGRDFLGTSIPPSMDGGVLVDSYGAVLGSYINPPKVDYYRIVVVGDPASVEKRVIPLGVGTANVELDTCFVCPILYTGCDVSGCEQAYFPRTGHAYLTSQPSTPGATYEISIAGVEFHPVTINETAGTSTPNSDSDAGCHYIPYVTLAGTVQLPGTDAGVFVDTLEMGIVNSSTCRGRDGGC